MRFNVELQIDKLIDSHVHMGKTSSGENLTVDQLLESMDKYNIEYSGLSILNGIETGPLNDKVMSACDAHPDRIVGLCYLNPRDPNAIEELKRCMDHPGMRGVKFHSWKHGYYPDNNMALDKIIDDTDPIKSKKYFYSVIRRVKNHLSLIFHRFISEDGLHIFINSNEPIKAWDPFVRSNPATQELADEEVWDPENKNVTYIQPYVLPHKTKFYSEESYKDAEGYKGWNRHQGIYLYRNRRLIIYGTWFDLIRKEPAFSLARIRIDISSSADADWRIDIKKSRASLPVYLRERVRSAVENCTTRSTKVFNSRGAYTKKSPYAPNLDFVWEQVRNNGNYTFKINKKHALLNAVRQQLDEKGRSQLKTYLALVEDFAPFMHNGIVNTVNTGTAKHDESQTVKNIEDIKKYITVFINLGFSKQEIQDTLLRMPSYEYLRDIIIRLVEETL